MDVRVDLPQPLPGTGQAPIEGGTAGDSPEQRAAAFTMGLSAAPTSACVGDGLHAWSDVLGRPNFSSFGLGGVLQRRRLCSEAAEC